MNKRLGWRIFYTDNSIVTGKTLVDWVDAPDLGVLAIQEVFERGVDRKMPRHTIQVYSGHDYYWMGLDEVIGAGPAEKIAGNFVKQGKWTKDSHFAEILGRALTPPEYGSFNQ